MKITKSLLFTPCLALSPLFFHSATAVETDPVGYVTTDLPAGASLIGTPLTNDIQFSGLSGSVSGSTVNLSGLGTIESPAYLLVLSGTDVGELSSIVSSTSSSVTLEQQLNGLAEGDSVRIISHFTLSDLYEASGSTISDNSSVSVYNSSGTVETYTIFSGSWFDSSFAASDNVIIFPGEGFVINLQSATSFTFVGNVNTAPFKLPVTSGVVNIVSSENPSTPTGQDSIGAALNGLGDNSTISIYSNDGSLSLVETYTLFSGLWFDSSFNQTEISVAAPSTIVVNPQNTSDVTVPAAYTSE
ncbi:MAG: hypothetical protein AAGH40_06260 [Verrucomicrobiota bacterium]